MRALTDNLYALKSISTKLSSDVALFEVCKRNPDGTLLEWQFLAARDGAMCLRNYMETLSAIRNLAGRVPQKEDIETGALKVAERSFRKRFPRVEKLRHSVAHPELYADPDVKMHTEEEFEFPGARMGPGTTVQESLFDWTFGATINGMTVRYDVTFETAVAVALNAKMVFSAFAKLDPHARFSARPA